MITSYHASMTHALSTTGKHRVPRQYCHSPLKGYIKINGDGSFLGNYGNASFGGHLKNDKGI
jgi:hypothetical protein